MIVNWRGDEYDFYPKTINGGTDNLTRYSNINGNIYGTDTESVQLDDRYEMLCFTFSSESKGEQLVYVDEKINALHFFLQWFLNEYESELFESKHHLLYYHNLEYDWLQLIKNDERLLEMARIGISPAEDIELYRFGKFRVTMKKNSLFVGSAPHVRLRISRGRDAFTLYIYDTFSFFPSSLDRILKTMNLGIEKMERQLDIGQVDYRTIDDSDDEKQYFEKYAKIDALGTRLIGEQIRSLHRQAGMTRIRPSSPAYAINLLFHMMEEEQSILTGTTDQEIMQLILDTYRGGRTGGIYHGAVDNMSVLDFHSSYPASMLSLPSFNPQMFYYRLTGDELQFDNVMAILKETGNAFLKISGTENDNKYPSLLTSHNGKLTPIVGDFVEQSTTGYEFFVGIQSGSLTNIVIHDCVVCIDPEEDTFLPFKVFAETAYIRKEESEKDSVDYVSAKLALNSSYGKLIESRSQTLIGASDGKYFLPFIEGMEKDFGNYYYSEYAKALENGERLADIYDRLGDELVDAFDEEVRKDMHMKMFEDFTISGRIYGRYVTPAAASLITGQSRARLLCAMKALGAVYWDTDSVFVIGIGEDSDEQLNKHLEITDSWLPDNAIPIRVGDRLGELDFELKNGYGYLAGTKRYYLHDPDKPNKAKRATHGIPALPHDMTEDVIKNLALGTNFEYESRPRPQKAKESKTKEEIGSFRSTKFVSRFQLDDRLVWERVDKGWTGTVKPFDEMETKRIYTDEELKNFHYTLEELKHDENE